MFYGNDMTLKVLLARSSSVRPLGVYGASITAHSALKVDDFKATGNSRFESQKFPPFRLV